MKPLTTVVLLIILYGTETGAQCYGNKNGKCQRIKDKKFQLQGVNISPFPVHSGQLNRLRRSQETTGSRLKYEKEEKEGPLPFEPKKNVDRSKYQPFAYALPNLRPLRPIQVDPASLSNLPSRALASPPAISPFDFIVKPLTDNLMNTSMIMMNQTLPEKKKQRKGKKSHKLNSHLTAKDEADTIQSSGGFGLNLKPLKSSKTDSTGFDDNGEPPKARKPAKENGVTDDDEEEEGEEDDEDFEGENGEIEKISRETSSTEDEDEENLDEETNSLEDEALDEAEKEGEEETTTGEEEVSTTIETTEGAEETEENEEVTDTTESSTVSTTSRPRTTTKRPMRDRMSFLNAVKEKKPRVLPGTKPMMAMGEEEGDEEEEEEPTEESEEEEEEEEEKLPKIAKPGNTQARGGIKKGRTMVSKETEGKASDEVEKEEEEKEEGEEAVKEEEEEGEEEEEETPTTKAPKKPVKPKKAEKPSKKQKPAAKQNLKNKKNGSKPKQSRKGAQGPDNTDIHKPGVRALLKDAPNVKYYYPPKVNLPLPSCFYNPTGYACCNIKLNNVMEETFAQMKEKKKFNPCNINMVARILQDVTQKEFEHPFETIVSLADFAQNVHFAGDLVCKVEIDGKFMLTYATPFHADAAKNATGGIGNHPGIMNIHHMRI